MSRKAILKSLTALHAEKVGWRPWQGGLELPEEGLAGYRDGFRR